ncbi:hypothetical protein Aple_050460 [Acrocarpospora pleiomorpha]|uniref:Uncharacterized protein n=1 Tax=Acrocarpospora pleiomorpha TaxID=90975 RepID=A0A5M3XPZ5_9ACTN|nr:hypothetical protein Aple_050460 [Acrocarpospora pleiomorpha]
MATPKTDCIAFAKTMDSLTTSQGRKGIVGPAQWLNAGRVFDRMEVRSVERACTGGHWFPGLPLDPELLKGRRVMATTAKVVAADRDAVCLSMPEQSPD